MALRRVAGIAYLKIDGRLFETSGNFTIQPGQPMREGKIGTSRVVGYSETPQVPSIEGRIVLTPELSLVELTTITEATIQVVGPTGHTFVLRDAWFAGEGSYDTGEGEVAVKFEGASFEEIAAV